MGNLSTFSNLSGREVVVSEWQAYVPTFSASWGTVTNTNFQFRRVGSAISVIGRFTAGTTTGLEGQIGLPTGLTVGGVGGVTQEVGRMSIEVNADPQRIVIVDSGQAYVKYSRNSTASDLFTALAPNNIGSNFDATINFTVVITEWTNSGTINIGPGSQVEYASNTGAGGTAAGAAYTTGSVAGSNGSTFVAVDSVTLGNYTSYKVSFQNPIQVDDLLLLEQTLNGGTTWMQDGDIFMGGRLVQNNGIYGAWIQQLDSTSVYVNFGNAGRQANSTYGAVGAAWSGIAAQALIRWRVRKVKATAPTGFGLAGTDGSTGLAQAGRLPGSVTGSPISTGYIGQVISTSIVGINQTSPTINTYYDDSSTLTLTPGVWQIYAGASHYLVPSSVPSGATIAMGRAAIRQSTTVLVEGFGASGTLNGAVCWGFSGLSTVVSISVNTAYKLSIGWLANSGSPTVSSIGLQNGPISSTFYAVRIA